MEIRWTNVALALLALAFLVWHPVSRTAIYFLLPLGAKPDDLMVWGVLAIAVAMVILVVRGVVHTPEILKTSLSLFLREKR